MRKVVSCLGLIICSSFIFPTSSADTAYSRRAEFSPISLTYNELSSILKKARSNIDAANAAKKTESSYEYEHLTIEDQNQSLELVGPAISIDTSRAPEIGYSISYRYQLSNAPISPVEIWLRDYTRTLKVEGTSPDQVDALFALLASELTDKTTTGGGQTFRLVAFLALLLFGGILLSSGMSVIVFRRATGITLVLVGIIFDLTAISAIFLPVDRWFPGTAIYSGDKFFIVRHAALFTFLGFLLALVPIIVSMFSRKNRMSRESGPVAQEPPKRRSRKRTVAKMTEDEEVNQP